MECFYSVLLGDREAVVNESFPGLGEYRSCLDRCFLNLFYADVCKNQADRASHRTTVYLLVCLSFKDKVVVRKDKI